LEEKHITYRPEIYSFGVAFAFILILAVAISYDCIVQRRLKGVIASAVELRAIVSSLFPERFRERLFQNEDDQNKAPQKDQMFGETSAQKNHNTDQVMHPAKLRLKSFLNETPKDKTADISVLQTKPVADLFPHCTVLFADIAGFTAWSLEREPAQVFTLLQTIFHYFDNIAREWGVLKVETIGDCYVAVTGLPDPQPDHGVQMGKFARECLRTFTELTHQLEASLGPDMGDLTMRFGLHSGPVTAGVLRGEKSRFQLFGETVNTASRMENTGRKDTIQISQTTADLLTDANKGKWLIRREDLVSIKGKGHIQTFWLMHRDHGARDSVIIDDGGNHLVELANGRSSLNANVQSGLKHMNSEIILLSIQDHQANSQKQKAKRLIDW
jgi:class 3 adenylate cyclase